MFVKVLSLITMVGCIIRQNNSKNQRFNKERDEFFRAVSCFDGNENQINYYINNSRKPRDTENELHEIIDAWFFNTFGIHARSSTIFCSQSRALASKYLNENGKMLEIKIPQNEPFKIIFSLSVSDLHTETRELKETYDIDFINDFLIEKNIRLLTIRMIFHLNFQEK